jgi:hypothetical protein
MAQDHSSDMNLFTLDEHNQPVPAEDLLEWAEWMFYSGREDVRRVELTEIERNGRKWTISTIFLGIDHGSRRGKPILFETMIFAEGDPDRHQSMSRYHTWEEAEIGHRKMVVKALKGALEVMK